MPYHRPVDIFKKKLRSYWNLVISGRFVSGFFLGAYGSRLSPRQWLRWWKLKRESRGESKKLFEILDHPTMILNREKITLQDDELVLGLTYQGVAKAYPIQYLSYHHIVSDHLGDQGVLITYCGRCQSGVVFNPTMQGRVLRFIPDRLQHGSMMMKDLETGSLWSHVTGEAVEGYFQGKSMEIYPSMQVTWSEWLKSNPQTLVMAPRKQMDWLYQRSNLGEDQRTLLELLKGEDIPELAPTTIGFGLKYRNKTFFSAMESLTRELVIAGTVESDPVVFLFHPESQGGGVFLSECEGRRLTLKSVGGGEFQDHETGSIWNVSGLSIRGEMQGRSLKNLNAVLLQWYAWYGWHPKCQIVRKSGF